VSVDSDWFAVPVLEVLGSLWDWPRPIIVAEELAEGFGEALMTGAMLSYLARIRTVTRTS